MSDAKKFDEFLKGSFSGYEPGVPAHIWENIIAERKKKGPVAWWTNKKITALLVACFSVAAAIGFILLTKTNTNNIALKNNDHSSVGAGKTAPAAAEKNDIDTKENTTAINRDNIPVKDAGDNDNAAALNNKGMAAATTTVYTNHTGNIHQPVINIKRHTGKRGIHSFTVAALPATDDETVVYTDNTGNNDSETSTQFLTEPGNRDLLQVALANADRQKTEFKVIPGPPCPKPEFDAAGNKQYFELYLGPDYIFKKYRDTGAALITKRKESLSFQSAYSAGLRYTRVFGNGMSIRAGINYSQVNEKFSYAKDNVVQIVYIINSNGDTTDSYYVRGTRYNNSYNYYRTIDLPVTIGYEMGNGRFHANINTGVVINLYSWQSGETLDYNFSPVNITTGKPSNPYQYKTNVGLGFIGAASLYYKLNDRYHLVAEPYLRYNFSPMNKEAITLQERFTTVGLKLGLRMDLR